MLQDKVLEHTTLLRRHQLQNGVTTEDAQRIVGEYDPVVCMALIGVDRRTPVELQRQCHAEVAKYVRPQLKSIEVTSDQDAVLLASRRAELALAVFAPLAALPAGQGGVSPRPPEVQR